MNIHFIAIGGAIMHQLAIALFRKGHRVTGSDDSIQDPARSNLAQAGILPEKEGWYPERITADTNAVVLGMHAHADNPELAEALRLGIPVYSFPQYIYEVSREKQRIVVAGSHGKTTITSMIMHMLRKLDQDFDYMVGARVNGFEQSVRLSEAPVILLEGDEYPASAIEKKPKIFFYHPHISILSGIAWDHVNVYPTYDIYFRQFEIWLKNMDAGTSLIYNEEDPEVVRLVTSSGAHLHTIPYRTPRYRYDNGKAFIQAGDAEIATTVFGKHNFLNLEAAVAVGSLLGLEKKACYQALTDFTGAARRLEKIYDTPRLTAFRDFAHAPSKLKATLDAVREAFPEHRLIACFELHTFSSLNESFLQEYRHSMTNGENALVYFSRHALTLKRLPDLDPGMIIKAFDREDLAVFNKPEELREKILALIGESNTPVCLLIMSSGTFDGIDWNALCSQSQSF